MGHTFLLDTALRKYGKFLNDYWTFVLILDQSDTASCPGHSPPDLDTNDLPLSSSSSGTTSYKQCTMTCFHNILSSDKNYGLINKTGKPFSLKGCANYDND